MLRGRGSAAGAPLPGGGVRGQPPHPRVAPGAGFWQRGLSGRLRGPSQISGIPSGGEVMPYAIRIHETGGPEVLRWETVDPGNPGPGEVLVRNVAVGLNYIDTYHRSGLYPVPLPATLGMEGAGVVESVGPRVKEFKAGDRVAYAQPIGAYAELCLR